MQIYCNQTRPQMTYLNKLSSLFQQKATVSWKDTYKNNLYGDYFEYEELIPGAKFKALRLLAFSKQQYLMKIHFPYVPKLQYECKYKNV